MINQTRSHPASHSLALSLCILLVEDDEADAYVVERALWDHPAVGKIVHVRDGVEALAAVQCGGLEPDIAFIDLRMPRMDGFELLFAISNDAGLTFPTIVLTSSSALDDVIRSRLRHANRVLIKPETVPEMSAVLKGPIDAVCRSGADQVSRRDPVRVQAQIAARDSARSSAALRSAASLARIGAWEVDFVMHRATFAPELCQLLGAPQADMSLAEANTFWVEEDRAAFSAALEQVARNGQKLTFEGRSLAADGSLRFWRVLGEPVLVKGHCVALRGVAQDITEWRDVVDREAGAHRTVRSMSGLLATMSHELRTPLNGVLGMAQAMQLDELSERQRERLSVIETSGGALLNLLNDALDLSKIEAGKAELEDGMVAAKDLADTARSIFTPLAEAKGVALTVSLTHAANGCWRGDPARVRQILHNLISNALAFTDEGAISVTISRAKGRLLLRVEHTGLGVPPAGPPRVSEGIVRSDTAIMPRCEGSGPGLTVSRELARMMGGGIEVESQAGAGLTFVASLPLSRCPPARERGPLRQAQAAAPMTLAGVRVLAAEDNPANQRVLTALLDVVGVDLTIASDGQEAFDLWRMGAWDVVLLDIQMPVLDGMAAASLIRAAERREGRPPTPIIALTASAVSDHTDQYLAVGMDDVVEKPIRLSVLVQTIARAIKPKAVDRTQHVRLVSSTAH